MSLKISNKATAKQIELLKKLGYTGNGAFAAENLTTEEAGKIIDELVVERNLTYKEIQDVAGTYYDYPDTD